MAKKSEAQKLRDVGGMLIGGGMALQGTRVLAAPGAAAGSIQPFVGLGVVGATYGAISGGRRKRKRKRR